MRYNLHKLTLLIFLILLIQSCITTKNIVNYQKTSVPEEGGIQFTQFTQEDENVAHPLVVQDPVTGILQWYAAPLLALSPDGNQLAYIAESNNFKNLYLKEIIGGNKKIQRTFNRNIDDMTYSPDGKNIAFTENTGSTTNINMINATEGAAITQITATSKTELGPHFSPDGKSIFYSVENNGRYYVWNVTLESSIKTQYSEGFTPVLTPDGENLLITRNNKNTGFGEIWMINLKKGTETQILSNNKKGFSSPAISPDGETILCVGVTPGSETRTQNLDIYTVRIDGTKLTQLTFHGGNDVSPIWSPDGQFIYFLAQRANEEGRFNVWRMNYKK
ncbi:MAG: hypothetical protein WED10_00405 [Brumimicrobium sp.]